jgi:uncharacterized protein (DUF1330 family)
MPPAYIVAQVDVTDPVAYEDYKVLSTRAIAECGGRVLVRGSAAKVIEGDWQPSRLVIIQFDSAEEAHRWYESGTYRAAREARKNASISRLVIVEGVAP